jgi:hypothetical protein
MKSNLKIVLFNIILLIIFLMLIDFSSEICLDVYHYFNSKSSKEIIKDKRASLPNYKNINWAEKFFEEKNETQSEYRSYYGWRKLPFNGITIQIDSSGVRRTIQSPEESDKLPVAIFLGGSTMWGMGVSDEYTIPSCFARRSNWKYKTLNFGESGYCAYQSFQFFQLKIINGLKPNLVISYDGTNNTPYRGNYFAHARENQIIERMKGADSEPEYKPYFLKPTRDLISNIKQYFISQKKPSFNNIPVFSKGRNRKAAIELLESWLLMRQTCSLINAEFICVLQPNAFVGKPILNNIKDELKYNPYQNGYNYYDDVIELLDSSKYSILKDNFINLTSAFDSIPNVYIDFCHVSPNGNEIIADLLIQHLEKRN